MDLITKKEVLLGKLKATQRECERQGRQPTRKEIEWAAKVLAELNRLEKEIS